MNFMDQIDAPRQIIPQENNEIKSTQNWLHTILNVTLCKGYVKGMFIQKVIITTILIKLMQMSKLRVNWKWLLYNQKNTKRTAVYK